MKKWHIDNNSEIKNLEDLTKILLKNREITDEKEIESFLSPNLSEITLKSVGINKRQVKKAVLRIEEAIKEKQKIIIYGDYDVDGVSASAILWETLNKMRAYVLPFIPSRFNEGYGLSIEGIDNLLKKGKVNLIITVDNGIVANEAVLYAKKKGIDVIITDHHVPAEKLPKAFAIVHTTELCGTGVAYIFSKEISKEKISESDNHIELVALATIADLVPLKKANRILVHFGIKALKETKRPGLIALCDQAGLKLSEIDTYQIGHVITPRLNAMGRLEDAMDSLRLVCTLNKKRAEELAALLSETNLERQQITIKALEHARNKTKEKALENLIFIADESYQQGIVGLVAGRLVEEFYLPSIVISKGKKISKASARSIKGFNIIEFLREASDLLLDVGGHPMAAGFTVETKNIEALEKKLLESVGKFVSPKQLDRVLRIDTVLPQNLINLITYQALEKLKPYGMANPEPTFLTENLIIENTRLLGKDKKHLKITFNSETSRKKLEGIAFGIGDIHKLQNGDIVNAVYAIDENDWNGNKTLQLKIKDLKKN